MYLTPEKFLEKYRRDRMPYFKIHKGTSISEKNCQERLTEDPHEGMGVDELLDHGADKLQAFFDSYEDGNVTVICKSRPKNNDGNASNVRWGDGRNGQDMGQRHHGTVGGAGNVGSPTRQMKEMLELMVLLRGVTGDSGNDRMLKMQMDMMTRQFELEKQQLKSFYKWRKEKEDYEAIISGPQPSHWESLGTELIGLVKPLAMQWMGSQGKPQQQLPTVNGTGTVNKADAKAQPGKPGAQQSQFHPMHNVSLDLVINYVREIACEVFPEFSVNEVMPALAFVAKFGREDIRRNVIPIIEAQRQQAAAAAKGDRHKDEEE